MRRSELKNKEVELYVKEYDLVEKEMSYEYFYKIFHYNNGKVKWDKAFDIDELIEMAGYHLPQNEDLLKKQRLRARNHIYRVQEIVYKEDGRVLISFKPDQGKLMKYQITKDSDKILEYNKKQKQRKRRLDLKIKIIDDHVQLMLDFEEIIKK